MEILFNESIPHSAWYEFLSRNPHATPFQSPEFYNLFNSVKNLSAEAIAVSDSGSFKTMAVITLQRQPGIQGFFSRRGIIYGGPLVEDTHLEALDLLLEQISKTIKRKVIYIETRNLSDYKDFNKSFFKNGWEYIPYENLTIDLHGKNMDEILTGMKYNRRREIRLTLEAGVIYKECETESELKDIYIILLRLYKNQIKLPLPAYKFFKALWRSKLGKIFVVMHNNNVIGGSFCLVQSQLAIYTMYYCGLRDYQKNIFPTHLAVLAAINYGLCNGLRHLDFMGVGKKDEEYGVRKYKQEFGGELIEFGRYLKINNPLLYFIGRFGLKLMRKRGK